MASAQWKIDNFISEVHSNGLAKPSRFEVNINVPICLLNNVLGQQVSMFCDQAYFPYSRVVTSRQQIYGPASQHPVGIDYGGEGVVLQFYVDREMRVKRFFDQWVNGIVDPQQYNVQYQRNYLSQMTISQLDESDTVTYKVKLRDAFPINVQALTLDAAGTGQVHKLTVTFAFRRWIEDIIIPTQAPVPTPGKPNPPSIYDTGTNIGPDFRGGYRGEPTFAGGGGYDPTAGPSDTKFIVT
jgi:hypothetical protein